MDELDDKSFEQAVFLDFWKSFGSTYNVTLRIRKDTYLLGTGNLYDSLTRSKFFQIEQMYPFDRKELLKDLRKLTHHVATECIRTLAKDFREQYGIRAGASALVLIDPVLVPAVWLYVVEAKHRSPHILGCVMLNLRLTVAFPNELPFGPGCIKLTDTIAPGTTNFDLQVEEDKAKENHDKKKLIT